MKKVTKGALMYPACVIIALTLAMCFLMVAVIPKFASMFASRGVDLPAVLLRRGAHRAAPLAPQQQERDDDDHGDDDQQLRIAVAAGFGHDKNGGIKGHLYTRQKQWVGGAIFTALVGGAHPTAVPRDQQMGQMTHPTPRQKHIGGRCPPYVACQAFSAASMTWRKATPRSRAAAAQSSYSGAA